MHTSTSTNSLGFWRAIASGLIIGAALVAGAVWAAYIPAPSSAGPGNNAATPIYDDATTQGTTNLGVKRATTAAYDFAVLQKTRIDNTFISQQDVIFDSSVRQDQNLITPNPVALDIQGNLYVMGTSSNPSDRGNIFDEWLIDSTAPSDSEAVCATQAGVLVRCLGCTDTNATNYDPAASTDNGSCNVVPPVPVLGCVDSTATNYNPAATQDDGSCVYPAPTGKVVYSRPSSSRDSSVNQTLTVLSGSCPGCTSTKFIVPPGVTEINIEAYGAGGGGGTSNGATSTIGSRGIGGAGQRGSYARMMNVAVLPGYQLPVTIGRGGSGGWNQCNSAGVTVVAPDVGGVGGTSTWNPFNCDNGYTLNPATYQSELTKIGGSNVFFAIPGGGNGANATTCSGGAGGQGGGFPLATPTFGTMTGQQAGPLGQSGLDCGSVTSNSQKSAGTLCPTSQLGLPSGFSYCKGGDSAIRSGTPPVAGESGRPGLIIISW